MYQIYVATQFSSVQVSIDIDVLDFKKVNSKFLCSSAVTGSLDHPCTRRLAECNEGTY